ncbi:MAG: glycosyl hydrolase family 76, partial [Firmicutes bacterium]|nr:glycosyl hydrolase family 76 [Bacillota bacterium]
MFWACGDDDNTPVNPDDNTGGINWYAAADSSSTALIGSFWNAGEKYFNYDNNGNTAFHYWPQAHALDVLVDAYLRTGDAKYKTCFDQWFEGVKIKNGNTFKNDYYDDMEWNALAILRAYQVTKDQKYKEAALQ